MDKYYKYYKQSGSGGESGWGTLFREIKDVDVGIYRILMNVSVYSAVIAFLCAVVLLAITAGGGRTSKEFAEAKKWLLRVICISVLIFAVTGIITLVGVAGLDS